MSDELSEERARLIRETRQRLESLRRAGVDRIPFSAILPAPAPPPVASQPRVVASEPVAPVARAAPARPDPPVAPEPPRRPSPAPPSPPAASVLPTASLFEDPAPDESPVPADERPARLATLAAEVARCERCPHLAASRTQTVFGTGSPTARLMFVGEAPGADEDRTGQPFVGRAGVLLTDMINKGMGLSRDAVYIANILKSRPPENRDPAPDEIAHCLPYLERQIAIVRPEYLCLLGRIAAQTLLQTGLSMGRLRGKWHRYRGIPAIVTYHPSYLLRNPPAKKDAWEDLKMLMQAMGLAPPGRK